MKSQDSATLRPQLRRLAPPVVDKDLTVQPRGLDAYKQKTTADVFLPDDTNVNHELIKDGWCWWYRKCVPGDTTLDSHGRIGSIILRTSCPLKRQNAPFFN